MKLFHKTLFLAFVSAAFFSCKKEYPQADSLLSDARSFYASGHFAEAKKALDSIQKVSPKAFSQINAGFDAALLNNKLAISVDYFMKETKDVLTPMQILMVTGNNGGNPNVNAATLQNTGIEVSATWRDKIGKDFGYSFNVNGSFLKNKIKELGYGRTEFTQWDTKSKVGHPIG